MFNVIYRLCENEADGNLRPHRPFWFSKQNCLKSFLNAVNFAENRIDKLIFVHDGSGDTLLNMIPKKYEIVKINENSNIKSLYKTYDIADELDGDLYFVEDDYLHLPLSILKIYSALPNYKLINGYDHSDRYTRNDDIIYQVKVDFNLNSNHHWRTAESTCCTYAIEGTIYKQLSPLIRNYGLNDRELFRHLHRIGLPLWTPIPGVTSQIDTNLSPGINWFDFNDYVSTIK